jgi:hypothetical protein
MKANTGRNAEYQWGWSFPGARRNRAPSATGASITPPTVIPMVSITAHFLERLALIHWWTPG